MQTGTIIRAGFLAIILSILVMVSWEIHLRNQGNKIYYDDNEAMWAHYRGMVYEPSDKSTVFLGSSRIKFDLDIPTWQNITGNHVIQLANVGSDPVPYLMDLADDKKFKGTLVVDVTEGLFFSDFSPEDVATDKKINYFKKITPTQRFSFRVNHVLESQFVFLDQDRYSINSMMDELPLAHRPGIKPEPDFPDDFGVVDFNRQSYMTPRFVADTSLQNRVKAIWVCLGRVMAAPTSSAGKLDSFFNVIKVATDKIKSRGGHVLFLRTPSSGPMLENEKKGYPRAKYWDRLLAVTGCPGIYYADYPTLSNFVCPEWSHLKPEDAKIYTKELIKILQKDKGWTFSKKSNSI
ncbi:MAG TPA: hypothetical protein VGZ90_15455 [Puia sp.]|jgi:hypothetical protein|nr:hypothetical protein [Puia sp.]